MQSIIMYLFYYVSQLHKINEAQKNIVLKILIIMKVDF